MSINFDGKKAYKHLKVLTKDIGPRHGGSKNEARAARHIRDYFTELGLKARLQTYPIYSFEEATASLVTPRRKKITCKPFPMTANTPARGLKREVVFLEDAQAAYLDQRVKDRIVVTFNTFGGETYEQFLRLKPAGLVSIQSRPRHLHVANPSSAAQKRKYGTIPSVCLTFEDGMALIENMPAELTMHSRTAGEKLRNGNNVIADMKGSGNSDDVIVVCAHYDSVWTGPGAFDNGGGTAAIMELARIYKKKGSKYNLRFMAFGGEEMGLWGSRSYVKKLKDKHDRARKSSDFERDGRKTELDHIRFVLNLDMMGVHLGRSAALVLGHSDIAASVRLLSNQLRYAIRIEEDKVYSSDNKPFNFVGIPSLSFNRTGFADCQGHTAGDTLENCSPEGLAHIGSFVEAWVDHYLLAMHTFPFPRTLPDSSRKAVDKFLGGKAPFADYDVSDLKKD